jgi:molybdopterin synthase sulfur carrier subunit
MAKIIIPTPLRKFTNRSSSFESSSNTVFKALENLVEEYPDLKKHLFDDEDNVRSFIKIYVGEEEIDPLNNGETSVNKDTIISIVPAIAGGSVY